MDDSLSQIVQVREVTKQGMVLDIGGQQFTWPAPTPPGVRAGDSLTLRLLTAEANEAERHERSRSILTEILGGKS